MPPADHQSLCKCAGDSDASEESKGIIWVLGLQGNVDGLVKFKLKMDWGVGRKILHAASAVTFCSGSVSFSIALPYCPSLTNALP